MTYGVLLTDDANRALESLPPEGRSAVLAALEQQLDTLAPTSGRRKVDGIEYVRATIEPWADVFYRAASPEERSALRAGRDGERPSSAYVVLVIVPLTAGSA